ncbi:MAG: hypothetical protein M5R40_07395 [Anaerolineae bacterium]|nr:hypothetical protein [Anaerolineae bacterium]
MQDEKLLLLRFAGRTDDYARQRDGGRYAPRGRAAYARRAAGAPARQVTVAVHCAVRRRGRGDPDAHGAAGLRHRRRAGAATAVWRRCGRAAWTACSN